MSARGTLVRAFLLAAVAGGVGSWWIAVAGLQEQPFPHQEHQGLFPLCTGCHEGVPLGNEADYYPEPASCLGCHDGVREERVTWQGPRERVGNVVFEHRAHDAALTDAGDPPQECASCHIAPGGERMAVADSIQLGTCWSCHAHTASNHQVDADCSSCHLPLASTAFDGARIAAIEPPADHTSDRFLGFDHGRLVREDATRCATCHTQERCVACHVDATIDEIAAFPAAPPTMDLPTDTVRYNEPTSHTEGDWLVTHGSLASRADCATCHTSNDCLTCHVQPVPDVLATLPARAEVVAPGVRMEATAPTSHESLFFMKAHPTLAASGDASCSTCHVDSFCTSCHEAPQRGGYHPPEFLSRHTAAAFGRDAECSTCHSTQVFCRECHVQVGLVGTGRLGPGYHDDGPVWLLRHGQAARQNLESCASCHRQVDCTQCHSVLGAFKVSPHSAGFDATRAWAQSPRTCLACHAGNPLNGR
jgi:hypothetical protein